MAELLKRYYPKHVDVHNYVAGNSIAKKVDNWCMLNRKVLSKIDMKLGKELINQLAGSQSGVIEKVLTDLRAKILKDCNADKESLYAGHEDGKGGKSLNRNSNGFRSSPKYRTLTSRVFRPCVRLSEAVKSVLNLDEVENKTVPRHVFVRLKQELQEKTDKISMLQQRISHLESIMKLKDQRIDDLTAQITRPFERNETPRPHVIGSGISNPLRATKVLQ